MKKAIYLIISLVLVMSMVFAACKTATETETPVVVKKPTEVVVAEEPTEEVMVEEPTEEAAEPTEEVVVDEGPMLASVPTAAGTTTDRKGGWVDEVSFNVVDSASAVTQIQADAIDIYPVGMSTR